MLCCIRRTEIIAVVIQPVSEGYPIRPGLAKDYRDFVQLPESECEDATVFVVDLDGTTDEINERRTERVHFNQWTEQDTEEAASELEVEVDRCRFHVGKDVSKEGCP